MNVLVTGATGFIGSRLSAKFEEQGHNVVALGQTNNKLEEKRFAELADAGVITTRASLFDEEEIRVALHGCHRVVHLASAQHEANVPESHFRRVNVDGVRILLELCLSAGVERFIHGSTIGAYGEATATALDENSPPNPQNIYGVTKLAGEKLALSYADRLFVSAIRISETCGPGDRALFR